MLIRKATRNDARGIVEMITRTWITTYKGLMPDEVLERHSAATDERVKKTEKCIETGECCLVAEDSGEIVGSVRYGESRNPDFDNCGEIYSLYVIDNRQKLSLGKGLLIKALEDLSEQGFNSVIVNVLDGNKAINFYKKHGGVEVGIRHDDFYGTVVTERIMLFKNIEEILEKR